MRRDRLPVRVLIVARGAAVGALGSAAIVCAGSPSSAVAFDDRAQVLAGGNQLVATVSLTANTRFVMAITSDLADASTTTYTYPVAVDSRRWP